MKHKQKLIQPVALVAVGLLTLVVSGCGTFFGEDGIFRDRSDDYLKASSVEPIKLPANSQGERIGQLFVIPTAGGQGVLPSEFRVPKPSSSDVVAEQADRIKIQKLGERRWIDVSRLPADVWPGVRDFLSSKRIAVAEQNPTAGTVETGWISSTAVGTDGKASMDRYRFQLSPGLGPRSTEIHVLQMMEHGGSQREYATWPEHSMDADHEAWMVRELASYLATNLGSQASMLAQNIGGSAQRVSLVQYPEAALVMQVDYDRAWASVSGSLNQDGFHVDNANREQGQWQITDSAVPDAEDDNKNKGMFASLFGTKKKSTEVTHYRVQLKRQTDESVRVTIAGQSGETLSSDTVGQLLRRVRDNLL